MSEKLRLFGGELEIIADENETNGQFDLLNGSYDRGIETPLHMHTKYSETIYLTGGEMTVYMKDKTVILKPGDHLVIPSGTPHAILFAKDGPSSGMVITAPSGLAKLVRTAGVDPKSGKEPDMELFKKTSEEIGDVVLGPPGTRP